MTSDAGLVLIAQLDKQYQISQQFAQGFRDDVTPSGATYPGGFDCPTGYGLVQGYPDLNDRPVRFDPMFGGGKLKSQHARCAPGEKYLE